MKRSLESTHHEPYKSPRVSSAITESSDFNRMKVCVRVRPFSVNELGNGAKSIIDVIDHNMLVFDPYVYTEANDQYQYQGKVYKEIGKRPNKNLQFIFDRVFDQEENNLTVYQETTKPLVASLLSGYNCSVFAYGSTGSGKTHTMLGSSDDPGVIFFTTMDLYKHIEEDKGQNFELSISYFEIYNEILYDLLDPTSGQPLSVLEDGNKGMTVKNLSIHQPRDADHLLELLEFGNKNRKQHPTDANSESSRSHAIFQIALKKKEYSSNQDMSIQVSKMSLVDLAGSERATVAYKSYRTKGLQREGGNINKSLLSLGNCINALANNRKNGYIPYRSSKLTLILRDSLGGNCQTLMIATVSQAALHYEEVHNTLLYAERAKGVQLNVRKNTVSIGVQPRDYKQMLEKMNLEKTKLLKTIEELKDEVKTYKNQAESIPNDPIVSPQGAIEKLNSVKNILDNLFAQRNDLRGKLLECIHNLKLLDLRLMFRTFDNERLKILESEFEGMFSESKPPDTLHSIYSQKLHYADIKSNFEQQIEEIEEKIVSMQRNLLESTNNDIVVRSYFTENNCSTQTKELKFWDKHCTELTEEFFSKNEFTQELISLSMGYINKSYQILNGSGRLTEDMENKFKSIIQKLKGKKSVVWRDNISSPHVAKIKNMTDLFKLPIYLNNGVTPTDKRSLVMVRDISPCVSKHLGKTPLKPLNCNLNNLGNTITKCKVSSTVIKPKRELSYYDNDRRPFNSYNRTPQNANKNFQLTNSNTWSKRYNSTRSFSNHRPNSNNENYSGGFTNRNFGSNYNYNPSFRPRFR